MYSQFLMYLPNLTIYFFCLSLSLPFLIILLFISYVFLIYITKSISVKHNETRPTHTQYMYHYRKRKGKMQYLLGGNKKKGFNGTRKRISIFYQYYRHWPCVDCVGRKLDFPIIIFPYWVTSNETGYKPR
jgi:hypothetical protein